MSPGKGELTFGLVESKPQPWATDALLELCRAGFIAVRPFNKYGGLVFTPLVDCRWALRWMMQGGDKCPEARLPVTEPVASPRDAAEFQRSFLIAASNAAEATDV